MNQKEILKIAVLSGTLAGSQKALYELYKEIKGREPVTAKIIKKSIDELNPIHKRLRALVNIKPSEPDKTTEGDAQIETEDSSDETGND